MLEECCLRLFGNSDSEEWGGWRGRRRGGGIAPDSARESFVPVGRDLAAAAHGGFMRTFPDMSKIMELSACTLAQLAPCCSSPEQNHRQGREKGEKQSQI
jgi:hypothetical protein